MIFFLFLVLLIRSQKYFTMMTSLNGNIFRIFYPLWRESTGDQGIQWPVVRSFGVFFSTNGWANNRDADDLRRNRGSFDVTVMYTWAQGKWMLRKTSNLKVNLISGVVNVIFECYLAVTTSANSDNSIQHVIPGFRGNQLKMSNGAYRLLLWMIILILNILLSIFHRRGSDSI